jgi:hypothetical protein
MNGDTALNYVRSRHGSNGEGSDFARARRQQKVLAALKNKLLSFSTLANPIRINNIRKSLEKHLNTNLEFADIITLIKIVKELNISQIHNLVFDDSEKGYLKSAYGQDGAYLLLPKTGNFEEVNGAIKNIFDVKTENNNAEKSIVAPAQTPPPTPTGNIEIQNGTWSAGLAARMKKRLEDRHFIVETIGNTLERPQTKSGIYNVSGRDLEILEKSLEEELHIPVMKSKPASGITIASSTDILVILGEDTAE